jgi:hypothetical protein
MAEMDASVAQKVSDQVQRLISARPSSEGYEGGQTARAEIPAFREEEQEEEQRRRAGHP